MNAAAATAFTLVMLLGTGGLTWLVTRMRATPTPDILDGDPDTLLPRSIYEQAVDDLGDPDHLNLDPPPCPPWPTWASIPDSRYQTAIAALANEH